MAVLILIICGPPVLRSADQVDYNKDIRRILSDNCFLCHGPDSKGRKGSGDGLRLDTAEGATADLGDYAAIVPGNPERSEIMARIQHKDPDERMPPPESGKALIPREVELVQQWIREGAEYANHWSYVKPVRSPLPEVSQADWPRNAIDFFVLSRLDREGLKPSPEADLRALARRVSLDLTGLPPTLDEVETFLLDTEPNAYERLVERFMAKKSFGEHWARVWLDQARYADSTGYADDPPRTIWGYRDYVIRALNENTKFDRFTIEQIAGDLMENPTEEQLIATAFHRNTLTNNEGGTNDEEYRNVAIVDRVNTTMEVWMGTTMACAQCHNHKYDPISQEDYFRLFAILNNTEDADRRDESPFISLFSESQKQQKRQLKEEIVELEKVLVSPTPELNRAREDWETMFTTELKWQTLQPGKMLSQAGAKLVADNSGVVKAERKGAKDVYSVETVFRDETVLTALRLDALSDPDLPGKGPGLSEGNFVLSGVRAMMTPPEVQPVAGRFLRIELPGKARMLSLAEVQVFHGTENIAPKGTARQSTTDFNGPAHLAIDGNTNGDYAEAKSTTHTANSQDPWWELDLQSDQMIDRLVIWNRTDNDLHTRLKDFRVALLDEQRTPVWQVQVAEPPHPSRELSPGGAREIVFATAFADHEQEDFGAASVLNRQGGDNSGWAVGGGIGQSHHLVLAPSGSVNLPAGAKLTLHLEHNSKHGHHTLGKFKLSYSSEEHAAAVARTPGNIQELIRIPSGQRNDKQQAQIAKHYLGITPVLQPERDRLAKARKTLQDIKPYTTVPILKELPGDKRRQTHIQHRGNFLDKGPSVQPGLPPAFSTLSEGLPATRMELANWLVNEENPLTARVVVNRFWESIFGIGIVRTSEEFGSQGELPSHQDLLDWMAVELMETEWDMKHLVKLMVTSATYRQLSKVTPDLVEQDPDNRLLARGPRFRMSAEMIRDQALSLSGLLSDKMYGPPVKPHQPKLGVNAAFGSGIDWETSPGEDRYRRGLYTMWRRSNPYPSMSAFDAPNREVCTVRRERTNTPLQALVTLNDPVYIEAAQALGRRMARSGSSPAEKARHGFERCLIRPPLEEELSWLLKLYGQSYARLAVEKENAMALATEPIGEIPEGADLTELAAWTVVANVLLNLDETLMKP